MSFDDVYQKALAATAKRAGVRCPTAKSLTAAFRIDQSTANKIRQLCKTVDNADKFQSLIAKSHPKTHKYTLSMYNSPYDSPMWRRTVMLDAINHLLEGFGVEALGPNIGGMKPPPYEYINMGDTYNTTLIYKRSSDNLFIGSWGDIAEKHPNW
jgi:hypothetical protein